LKDGAGTISDDELRVTNFLSCHRSYPRSVPSQYLRHLAAIAAPSEKRRSPCVQYLLTLRGLGQAYRWHIRRSEDLTKLQRAGSNDRVLKPKNGMWHRHQAGEDRADHLHAPRKHRPATPRLSSYAAWLRRTHRPATETQPRACF